METAVMLVSAAISDVIRLLRGDYFGYELSPGLAYFNLVLLTVALVGLTLHLAARRHERRERAARQERFDAITGAVLERRRGMLDRLEKL